MAPAEWLSVEVVYCPRPGEIEWRPLQVVTGAVIADALASSGMLADHAEPAGGWRVGIWGRSQALQTPLRQHDRVELYRSLLVDPKEARRQRYKRHRPAKGGA
jgi:uncharacterized protein